MRAGRMTAGQERGWQHGFPKFGLTLTNGTLDWDASFGGEGRRVVEIGFGMGDSLLSMAQADPETQFVGIEVHRPGVGRLLAQVMAKEVSNLRVFADDAVEVMSHCLAPDSIDGIHIFFPDPWHKKRHHKRRLIQPPFVRQLVARLREGGYLHLATDWEPYAEEIESLFGSMKQFNRVAAPWRPQTKFERRGVKLGHTIFDLAYRLVD